MSKKKDDNRDTIGIVIQIPKILANEKFMGDHAHGPTNGRTRMKVFVEQWAVGPQGLVTYKNGKTSPFATLSPGPVSAEDFAIDNAVNNLLQPKLQPQPQPQSAQTSIPDVEYNSRGPLLNSLRYILLDEQIRKNLNGRLSDREIEFLDDRKAAAEVYPQVMFTTSSAMWFETLCYKAKVVCPFHITPGSNARKEG